MKKQNIILLILVALLLFTPLWLNSPADFQGTDDKAASWVKQIYPQFQPWFTPFLEPSEERLPWLFAFQAGIGAAVIGYIIGFFHGFTEN